MHIMKLPALPLPAISFSFTGLIAVTGTVGLVYLGSKALKWVQYVGKDEQLLLKQLTAKVVINGPVVYVPNPLTTLSLKKRKGISLTALQYLFVEDEQSGETKIIPGPKLYMRGPYETEHTVHDKSVLGPNEAITVANSTTGELRLVKGPTTFVPGPLEKVVSKVTPKSLTKNQYIKLQDKLTGKVWVECGEKLLFLEPHWVALGEILSAFSLKRHQYIRLQDSLTGTIRVERGDKMVFPGPFEAKLDQGVMDAIDLKSWEYVVIQDRASGKVRVERGEKLVWLGGNDRVMGLDKEQAVKVDEENAVLVRNNRSGELSLVEKPQLFFPSEDEEVVEVRRRIKLADNEAIVLKDGEGRFHFKYGDPAKGSGAVDDSSHRSFFLPPYWEVVTLFWSRGRRREKRDLAIKVFDMRPQYMSFEFNCRTSDNVEMILEGTFFWEVVDLPAMMRFTGDASGDVCAHARSCFIQLVSKVTLQSFMDTFNDIARAAHSNDDTFYSQRGIKIHSLEVTRYQCADRSTSAILEAIIQETTNRMNRLSCQESENEVALAKLRGQVDQERATSEVLSIQHEHEELSARATGKAEAERCLAFLDLVRSSAAGTAAAEEGKDLAVELWHVLRKGENLAQVANGSAHVYFTPADAHLTIENRN